jgi:hypothetical protein
MYGNHRLPDLSRDRDDFAAIGADFPASDIPTY